MVMMMTYLLALYPAKSQKISQSILIESLSEVFILFFDETASDSFDLSTRTTTTKKKQFWHTNE